MQCVAFFYIFLKHCLFCCIKEHQNVSIHENTLRTKNSYTNSLLNHELSIILEYFKDIRYYVYSFSIFAYPTEKTQARIANF